MKREWQIAILTHVYPVYIVLDMRYNLGEAAYNVIPPLIMLLLFYVWVSNSHVRLSASEKRSLWFLIFFRIFVTIYYEICIFIGKEKGGFKWICEHNYYILYFILFMLLFYGIHGTRRWRI